MAITGLERLIYGASDVDAAVKFQRDWGMDVVSEDGGRTVLSLLDGTQVHIHPAEDDRLRPPVISWAPWEHSTLREAVWGVKSEADLQELVDGLSADREITIDENGVAHTADDTGFPIALMVTTRQEVTAPLADFNSIGNANRVDAPAPGSIRTRAQPYSFSHIVYWVNEHPDKFSGFYVDKLGFRVTDQISDGSTFLQADGRTDHHNLFIQYSGDGYSGFQHISYEYQDFDAVMMLGLHMEAEGWKTNVGPIRHNIGSSLSWYIWNPAGGVAEALTDQDQVGEDWSPRKFNTDSPNFYGHTWVARKEHRGIRPAEWVEE